ncbi:MAG: 2TM domain-containing protein [Bacteroidota bacterium]
METQREQELWKLAKKRVGFKRHLATYIVINGMFWLLWYFTDHRDGESAGVPWPVFPMIGWGIGLVFSFLNAYVFSKHDSVEKEYEKLKNK